MTRPVDQIAERLAEARERAGFTQDEVALLVGQQRPVISNWESGTRKPNSLQLSKLAAIYRIPLDELLGGEARPRPEFEQLMFRAAGDRLDARGKAEIQSFLRFLDDYGDFLEAMEVNAGLLRPPMGVAPGFETKEDIRRKAEEARNYFNLGSGPVGGFETLMALADHAGIAVYLAPLGQDLKKTVSGAFLPHHKVGFSILINAETTPGRRQFTLAHELIHALFQGDGLYVDYFGRREAVERFTDAVAAEFLVPAQSLRAAVEALGVNKVRDPELAVDLQRYFGVSYAMLLVRLREARLLDPADLDRLRAVQPVKLAESLGYTTESDEWGQDPSQWGLTRYPMRFLRLLRKAFEEERITISGAAAMTGLAQEEIEHFLRQALQQEPSGQAEEFEYFSESA